MCSVTTAYRPIDLNDRGEKCVMARSAMTGRLWWPAEGPAAPWRAYVLCGVTSMAQREKKNPHPLALSTPSSGFRGNRDTGSKSMQAR